MGLCKKEETVANVGLFAPVGPVHPYLAHGLGAGSSQVFRSNSDWLTADRVLVASWVSSVQLVAKSNSYIGILAGANGLW